MIDLTLDVEQYDCPYIAATDDHDVAFSTLNWEFDRTAARLETRMVVDGGDRATLDSGLTTLREHDQIHEYDWWPNATASPGSARRSRPRTRWG